MEDTLETLIEKVKNKIGTGQYLYVCNDPERALGLETLLPNFHIIHIDRSQYLDDFAAQRIKNFCWLEKLPDLAEVFRSSYKLLKSPELAEYLAPYANSEKFIQTFKISPAFEKYVSEMNATLMNTSGSLNRTFEDKLSQYRQLEKLAINLPKTVISKLGEVKYLELQEKLGASFVVQFDRGHTGSGTVFINSEEGLQDLIYNFPEREVRISEYVQGAAYTLNACVLKQGVVLGGLSKQITGIKELTPQPGGTVGNDWSNRVEWVAGYEQLVAQVKLVGEAMRAQGYLGMFGMDLMVTPDGNFKFIEINARQPASIPMYTKMQLSAGQIPLSLLHIAEFLSLDYKIDVAKYTEMALLPMEYSQIFVRALKDEQVNNEIKSGFYRLQGDNSGINRVTQEVAPDTIFIDEDRDKCLMFYGQGYVLDNKDSTGILLLTPTKGRKIKVNEEIGRLQIKQSAFANTSGLKLWIIESLVAIRDYQI